MFICFSNDVFYVVAYKTVSRICFLSLAEVKKIFSANVTFKKCSSTDIYLCYVNTVLTSYNTVHHKNNMVTKYNIILLTCLQVIVKFLQRRFYAS